MDHWITRVDADGQPLSGAHRYILSFEDGQAPPADVVWSVTMQDEAQGVVENALHRHAIGAGDTVTRDEDGSLTIYVQHASPGADRVPNWLPAPAGAFNLTLRVAPPAAPDGSWSPPTVTRVS